MKKFTLVPILLGLLVSFSFIPIGKVEAATPALSYGSKSGDVWDLQFRLRTRGYFSGKITGVYDTRTAAAVRNFQRNYGLRIDGIAGPQMRDKLKKVSVNASELDALARLVYSESRGEPFVGQVAVASVVMNRVQSHVFPESVKGVIFQRWAFTAVDDGQYWLTPNAEAYKAALEAVRGWDPSHHSLYYFNPATATSGWIWSRPQTVRIGHHIFAR
ncbi:spore cortex-lytic enzyme [Aneurinibacillus terranovensis]|uniref:spore cortex-lytic enzyme n=1 Tax=Aneurinibacillus terranovensis TaxID=278991 RepID=UPI0003F857DC|nr:spore cortex-lytic enzyme [Aneurinibacillus terranovensis]